MWSISNIIITEGACFCSSFHLLLKVRVLIVSNKRPENKIAYVRGIFLHVQYFIMENLFPKSDMLATVIGKNIELNSARD